MDTMFRFPSLASPDHAFTFQGSCMDLWDSAYRTSRALWLRAGMYKTFGDGMAQHSGVYSVPAVGHFADYCASLAAYLLGQEATDAHRDAVVNAMPKAPTLKLIRFALSVKHGDKRAYYTLEEGGKISKSDTKRHDKRWEEVPHYADGSVKSAYRILRDKKGVNQVLSDFVTYEAIRAIAIADELPNVGELASIALELHEDVKELWKRDEPARIDSQAFEALSAVVQSYQRLSWSKWALDVYQRNTARPRAAESEDKAA